MSNPLVLTCPQCGRSLVGSTGVVNKCTCGHQFEKEKTTDPADNGPRTNIVGKPENLNLA